MFQSTFFGNTRFLENTHVIGRTKLFSIETPFETPVLSSFLPLLNSHGPVAREEEGEEAVVFDCGGVATAGRTDWEAAARGGHARPDR